MKLRKQISLIAAVGTAAILMPQSALAVALVFDTPVEATDSSFPSGLGDAYSGSTYHFIDVAQDAGETIDVRITYTTIGTNHSLLGTVPNYHSSSTAEPNGDVLNRYTSGAWPNNQGAKTGGVSMLLEFFYGTGGLSGTFGAPITLDSLNLVLYDVDGEADQSENVNVFSSDGLVSYVAGAGLTSNAIAGPLDGGVDAGFHFEGIGSNREETDIDAAGISLLYEDTSAIRLELFAVSQAGRNSGENNHVYTGIDGDASLLDPPLPEPSAGLLSIFGLLLLLRRRRH